MDASGFRWRVGRTARGAGGVGADRRAGGRSDDGSWRAGVPRGSAHPPALPRLTIQ